MAELEPTSESREAVAREFFDALETAAPSSPERRRFIQLMGASLALAGIGCRWQKDKLLPFARRPQGATPGEPRKYATSMELGGWATGLVVTSYDGRPVKIEGNPLHPASAGAANVFHQASVLGLYDPDRSAAVVRRVGGVRAQSSWAELEKFWQAHSTELDRTDGRDLRVLADVSSSPTRADLRRRFEQRFPQAQWIEHEPAVFDNERAGTRMAFGAPYGVHLDLEKASVIVSLDADVIAPGAPNDLAHARALAHGRAPEGSMNRVYAVESAFSLTGSVADHRLAVRAEQVKVIGAALDSLVSAGAGPLPEAGPAQGMPRGPFIDDPKVKKFVEVVAKDLLANAGKSVVIAGAAQPPELHALAARLNALLGNVGSTLWYSQEQVLDEPSSIERFSSLVWEMSAGDVGTLIILGQNPVYTAPADLGFAEALAKVNTSVHLGLYEDETAERSTWHVPASHYLESWGDGLAYDGTLSLTQPLILPLWHTMSTIEFLSLLIGDDRRDGLSLMRRTHRARLGDDRAWRKAVHDGMAPGEPRRRAAPRLRPLVDVVLSERELGGTPENGQLELVIGTDCKVYDGRFANNGWLQELPEPFTKLTWQNAALMSPRTAARLGVKDGTLIKLTARDRSITLPAMLVPGHADGSVKVTLGYGRTAAGYVGGLEAQKVAPVGANAYALRTTELYSFGAGLEVQVAGDAGRLPTTQDTHSIDQLGSAGTAERLAQIVRKGTLVEYRTEPDFAKHKVHHPPLLDLWRYPVAHDGHRWGMSIDLNRCIGCSACVTACQAENNIVVVGREQVANGREMLWLRVDRYYAGDENEPEVCFQPMPCQQCENAPCEQVCPVGATTHSSEGLNDMVYNRCIGTRYCSNNCPYKVRRFNYLNFNLDTIGITPWTPPKGNRPKLKSMVFNPEVTVRSRGVMEKCTYCVQRIQRIKIQTKNLRRPIKDGEIKTACQQTCPTDAIIFGDLNDEASRVAQLQNLPRSYAVLEELNNRPRTRYLARIENPHPELA